ncbi:MAG: CoA transferase [Bacteroidia bacterium]|nr:CoA transferase [Bacteroidia bacterium]
MLPGPLCTMMLADFGAEVIRVEPTNAGDLWRYSVPRVKDVGGGYLQVNRNKKSINLNLKNEEAREVFYKLAKDADVIVEQYRPGVAARLGVDYETIKAINPKIVYCSLSGFGQDGPYRLLAGHDINYISYAGILGLTARKGEIPAIPGVQIGDVGGGALYAAIGILIALMGAKQNGVGQYVDTAMLDGAVSMLTFMAVSYLANGEALEPNGNILIGQLACYNVYETKDSRYISMGGVEAHLWGNFCDKIGKEDFKAWQRDVSKQPEMFDYLRAMFKTKTLSEWLAFLDGVDCCVSPVLTVDEVFDDPQVKHREMVIEMEDPKGEYGTVKLIGSAIKLSETPARKDLFPPRKGEHTVECLRACGYSEEEISGFAARGVI